MNSPTWLDELERLEKAATAGWFQARTRMEAEGAWWGKVPDAAPECVVIGSEDCPICCTNDDGLATERDCSHAQLIVALRNAAPRLIAIARAAEELDDALHNQNGPVSMAVRMKHQRLRKLLEVK